ncbi:14243_t:CDS:2 [Cetraspora pellucida]|uniref:14243_t:CDS:1 n=1 Tax=Cetraspora pellucida TaxID=1433469 RepID=A0A9N8W8B4_9GLOM|nr:14243_t:CDS:2 [Cetraspora pellucida]
MKQQKETIEACSVLALGRPSSMPQNYSSSEDIQRKYLPYYNPDLSCSPASMIEPFSLSTAGNYCYYPPLFSLGPPTSHTLSPESSSPETCSDLDLDLTDSFSADSPPSYFTDPSFPIKMENLHQSSLNNDHDYNVAMAMAKEMPIGHFSPYSTQESPFVGVLQTSQEKISNISNSTTDSLFEMDAKSLFQRELCLDARDYFSADMASEAARRKSLDDAIFLRKIASTPVKSEVAFQQHNRRKSLPGNELTQRLHIETLGTTTKQQRKSTKSLAPFACPHEHCPKTFTRQYNLKSHLRTHTDERPFVCNYPGCPRAFARQHDLKRHQKLHLGLKPHVCGNCGRAFARLDALNRHLRSDNATQCAQATLANPTAGKLFKSVNI